MEQRTKEWFDARRGRITGSRAGAILGLSPWMKPHEAMRAMVREWHGAESEFTGNVATEYGSKFEPYALADIALETGFNVEPCGFFEYADWLGASPDGLIGDDAVVECKCPYSLRNDENPVFKIAKEQPHYYVQIQLEMLCAEKNKCYFYQWTPRGYSMLEVVYLDETFLAEMLPKLREFYDRYRIERADENSPHLEPLIKIMTDTDWGDEYRSAVEHLALAQKRVDNLREKLIEKAGGQKCQFGDLLVYPTERAGSVSYSKIVKDLLPNADLEPYRGKPSTVWVLK